MKELNLLPLPCKTTSDQKQVSSRENLIFLKADIKTKDQPVHLHNLISVFVKRYLKSILREKSLAIYFGDSQFRRNRTSNFIVSKMYVDKRSRVR